MLLLFCICSLRLYLKYSDIYIYYYILVLSYMQQELIFLFTCVVYSFYCNYIPSTVMLRFTSNKLCISSISKSAGKHMIKHRWSGIVKAYQYHFPLLLWLCKNISLSFRVTRFHHKRQPNFICSYFWCAFWIVKFIQARN